MWVVVGGTDPSQTNMSTTLHTLDLQSWRWESVAVGSATGLRGVRDLTLTLT